MDFPHVVITPGLPGASYTTPKNKGNEAGPFLAYIIENYERLPAHMAFIHGHRVSHHTYQLDIVPVMKAVRWGSAPYIPLNVHMYQRVDDEKPEFRDMAKVWPLLFTDIAPRMPREFLSWCCAQFVVTRAAVRARPLAFYQKIYDWVTDSNTTSYISSRVMEQTWHMIFGLPPKADMVSACDVFDCDVLDSVTATVETWEGTPFDRIPCKVYETHHIDNPRRRATPTHAPRARVFVRPPPAELAEAERQTQAFEEGLERKREKDAGMRASGELRALIKEENPAELGKVQFGYGRPEPPRIKTEPWKAPRD
jgi:hypothetical protein